MTKTAVYKSDISVSACGYRRLLEIISSKWTVLVIYALQDGRMRYGEVRKRIEGISQKMLTQTFRQLERDGLVKRDVYPSVPPIVEYELTPLGDTLIPHLRRLQQWTTDYYSQVEQARVAYDRDSISK
ncbi:winged helix-turn-helix transcriptional regulator [Paenibacillus beijingensis]|uniref:HxlR family transcriptional regulator n=1 Tax=Paenibacillus beijingensis TaxID=1126833 RepID=A0A0D5NQ33_9BACL|nr:helix-turn-helix domain-containing protein [Paenibacillus beijingensis]AJY77424.1 HxlR family transcriptional regulator [Paenibacillus beijingensis]